jgi:hypothetical protein
MQQVKFGWKGFVLAPLAVPFVCSVLFVSATESRNPLLGILVLFAIGSVVSYGATAFLLLPCLYLVSKFTVLTVRLTCVFGALLGAVAYLPYARIAFQGSGDNSGPPKGTFTEYLWRQLSEPVELGLFVAGGLATAALYWVLAEKPRTDHAGTPT